MATHASIETLHVRLRQQRGSSSRRTLRYRLYACLVLLDSLAIFVGFSLAGLLRHNEVFGANGTNLATLVIPVYLLIALQGHAYGYQSLSHWAQSLGKALTAFLGALATVLFIAFYAHDTMQLSRLVSGVGCLLAGALLIGERYAFRKIVQTATQGVLRDDLIIVDRCAPIRSGHATVVNAADCQLSPTLRDPDMLDRLGHLVRGMDYVLVCCRPEDRAVWSLLLKGTDAQGYVIAPEFDAVGANRLERYNGHCVMQITTGPLDLRRRFLKRAMDLAFTVPALVMLSPFMLLVAILIKLDSPGPIFFRQRRMGRGNRMFSVLKFRSMRTEACDLDGARSADRDDQRVTRVGRFIRSTSIDELPQLFNVLHGQMSLVGPRPHALGSLAGEDLFWDVNERYWHRHCLKPGITGLAQIRGLRGATHQREDLARRLQADLEYLNTWSLWGDIAILIRTVRVIVHPNAF